MKDYLLYKKGKIKISFAWYDIWVGFFIDTGKCKLYICPFPMVLVTIRLKDKISNGDTVKLWETCDCDNPNKVSEIQHGLKLCTKCRGLHKQVE